MVKLILHLSTCHLIFCALLLFSDMYSSHCHAVLPSAADSCVCVAGFGAVTESCGVVKESHGCTDAFLSESYLTLAFPDRLESWDLQKEEKTPSWSMELKTESFGMPQTSVESLFQITAFKDMFFIFRLSFESASGAWRLYSHKSTSLSTLIPTFESQECSSECRTCNSPQCHWSCVHLGTGQVDFILTSLESDSTIILTSFRNIHYFKPWSVRAWRSNL